ncbi:restriction endonuclease subunit S [Halochromatium glycolicum]|uniref:restriction endonuclease subunit S n=1 Tax=Halochromatium glycolicum TaxID=85075 RepID=UPI00190AC287|nr:hypothetical protein [Halochromatium glycolicum]
MLIRSSDFVKALEEQATGATMLNLSNKTLGAMEIALPSVEVQHELLERISDMDSETMSAGDAYRTKLTDLTDLRQSLLQKAFAGELT